MERFRLLFAGDLRRQRVNRTRGFRHWRWRLDEMYVKMNGEMVYFWRAVDHEGEVLKSYGYQEQGRTIGATAERGGAEGPLTE